MSNPVELLRRALDELIAQDDKISAEFCCTEIWDSPPIIEEIRAYLDAEPEVEPVANYYAAKYVGDKYERAVTEWLRHPKQDCYLYTRPEPARKPLTSNERLQGFIELRDKDNGAHLLSFLDGICFAEKHHKIGDEE